MLRKGQGLGYGFSFIAPQDMKIATIAIGYADGFNRLLSNGVGEVFIAGKRAKVVGKVCMDLTMVDVSQIACEEGDEVEIFGKNIRVREIAEKLNTIPYEVLTSVSQRVKRIYTQE
jgi:alanine racemase